MGMAMLKTGKDKKGRDMYAHGTIMKVSDVKADKAEGVEPGHYHSEGALYKPPSTSKTKTSKTKVAKLSASEEKKYSTLGKATINKRSLLGQVS